MARIHGRHGQLYLGATTSADASPVAATTSWTIESTPDFTDVTAQGDTSKRNLAGLPGSNFNGDAFYDDAAYTGNFFTAAMEGLSRKAYFYPNRSDSTKYFFGRVFVGGSLASAVGDGTKTSFSGAFETDLISVGIN